MWGIKETFCESHVAVPVGAKPQLDTHLIGNSLDVVSASDEPLSVLLVDGIGGNVNSKAGLVVVLRHLSRRAIQLALALSKQLCLPLHTAVALKNRNVDVLNDLKHYLSKVCVAALKAV